MTTLYRTAVSYRGFSLIPAPPQITWAVDKVYSGDGVQRSEQWAITVRGVIVSFAGSPDTTIDNGNSDAYLKLFYNADTTNYPSFPSPSTATPDLLMARMRDKQEAIRRLFSIDYLTFTITPANSSPAISFKPRITKVSFDDGKDNWVSTCPYTISMTTDVIQFGNTSLAAVDRNRFMPEEIWSCQPDEIQRTYAIEHTISAIGRKQTDNSGNTLAQGWEVARQMILGGTYAGSGTASMLGLNTAFVTCSGVQDLNSTSSGAFNYWRSQAVDEAQGKFSVTEKWLVTNGAYSPTGQPSGNALEDFVLDNKYSIDTGLVSVTAQGTITGLEERDNTTHSLSKTKYSNAQLRFSTMSVSSIASVAASEAGVTLNPTPLSTSVTYNKIAGIINYSYSYNNRNSNASGWLIENYTVSQDFASEVVAQQGVIARSVGPVLQDIGSKTAKTITISAEIQTQPSTYGSGYPSKPVTDPTGLAISVLGTTPSQFYMVSDKDSFNIRSGRFTRNTTFLFQ